MKLIRFGEPGSEIPGLQLDDGRLVDTSSVVNDYNEEFFASDGLEKLQEWASANANDAETVSADHRIGSPIARPSKMICIGLNFSDHAAETGAETPKEPVIFSKATSALNGPFDNIVIPKGSEQTDWEVELAIVIGKHASYISESEAEDYVAGYVLHNDVSERS
ncbi:MAG: fumarylacetoacetate hydrolase family protein, partial [Verrucomicrobiales bacterium]|nr:fumarylacetoacetate hydrolase family protein [Verrucomicrobiales bacterium]